MSKGLKITFTALLVTATLLIISQALDQQAQRYTGEALKRSLVTFGVARALNGVISVAQGTEIALQPAGVGLTFTPGQILDPINDLVERFSWVVLLSSASLGIQRTLLVISAWPWFSVLTLLCVGAALLAVWHPRFSWSGARVVLLKLALVAVLLRLSVPLLAVISEGIYQEFLSSQYDQATAQLQQTADNIGQINRENLPPPSQLQQTESFWDAAKRLYGSATEAVDIEAKLEQYKEAAAATSEHLLNLIIVFIFQTILLPLLFLVCLYGLVRYLIHHRPL